MMLKVKSWPRNPASVVIDIQCTYSVIILFIIKRELCSLNVCLAGRQIKRLVPIQDFAFQTLKTV